FSSRTPKIYQLIFVSDSTPTANYLLSLHDALPISATQVVVTEQFLPIVSKSINSQVETGSTDYIFEPSREEIVNELIPKSIKTQDRKSTRLNSSHVKMTYADFCLKNKISDSTHTTE